MIRDTAPTAADIRAMVADILDKIGLLADTYRRHEGDSLFPMTLGGHVVRLEYNQWGGHYAEFKERRP